ncbi:NADH:ubiquinone oxidoreductase [Saitozyma podzolica]|uniref:NADH:ubiquinone oxidoreductase n=1 Tax=Saitozyma podzolica TaxID=1890683 RepID=A0A427YLD0_9TREE|nr:NADH:ubiquinone oxidoreductase [Saitozyma podzolica]
MSDMLGLLDAPGPNGTGVTHNGVHKMPSSSTIGLDDDEDMNFNSPEEEAAHYRERYRRIVDMLDETRNELDDFQASSKELEDELEKELAATEKQQAELKERIKRLEAERDEFKNKLVNLQKMHSSTTGAMQREMDNLRSERDKTLVALRELEMGNDELERNERVAVSSLLDLESKYNRAIEEKTLLEQEVVQKQELEEECQRLKDELRDANNEVAILRDQLTRSVPTPPSSVSVQMSPVQESSLELSHVDLSSSTVAPPTPIAKSPAPPTAIMTPTPSGLTRSNTINTISSIPTMSPAAKRFSAQIPSSPSGIPTLARSTTSRNLAASASTPLSPAMSRSRTGLPQPSPGPNRVVSAKSKGFRLLHDLQARLKATDDKLGTKVPKRNVSGPMPLAAKRAVSSTATSSASTSAPVAPRPNPRVSVLSKQTATPISGSSERSGSTFLSPNGWILVSDAEETPPSQIAGFVAREPLSPLESSLAHRAVSSASTSSRPLPARPGIPSPLAGVSLSKSTGGPTGLRFGQGQPRPPSRSALSQSTRAPSRNGNGDGTDDSRPMSPSFIPQPSRASLRAPSPALTSNPSSSGWMSGQSSATSSRPSSRTGSRLNVSNIKSQQTPLGRGPPPASANHTLAALTSTPTPSAKRSARRSSLGPGEAGLPPTNIPGPARTPARPVSVPVFGGTPPPVPRIPSAHLKDREKRNGMIGHERRKSGFGTT